MGALPKEKDNHSFPDERGDAQGAPAPSPDAFVYKDDVTLDAIRKLQEEADKELSKEEWELVDGFEW